MAGVDTSHLCCMITATNLNAIDMLLPGIPVLFPCKCPLCSVLVVAECGSNLHARPEGCGQCVCPATLLWFPSKGHHSL